MKAKLTRMHELEPWFQRLILTRCAALHAQGWNKAALLCFWRGKGLALTPRHLTGLFQLAHILCRPSHD